MSEQGSKSARSSAKKVFISLALVFIVPIVLAWFMYANRLTFGGRSVNHGHLINPSFAISLLPIRNAKGQLLNNSFPQKNKTASTKATDGKWMLLLLAPKVCAKACENGLYNIRQVKKATGKNRARILRAVLTYQNVPTDKTLNRLIHSEYQGTQHLQVSANQFTNAIGKHVHVSYATKPGALYVVDPNGNMMMVYKPNTDPTAIFKDVERLLKISQIG